MEKKKIQLKVSKEDPSAAYVFLPGHPQKVIPGLVEKQIRLLDVIPDYEGPDIYLDFDAGNGLIGIEILA